MTVLFWLVGLSFAGGSASLDEANTLYANGDYSEASQGYSELLQAGHRSGDVYYNLGNALYREGRLGHAVLAWEIALQLKPRDGDAKANVRMARELGGDSEPVEGFSRNGPLFLNATLSQKEQAGLAALLFFFLGVVFLSARRRKFAWEIPALFLGIPGGYLLVSVALSQQQPLTGVVMEADVPVRSALGTDRGVVLRTLTIGSTVRLIDTTDDYTLVELPNGESGWVGDRHVGRIDAAGQFPL